MKAQVHPKWFEEAVVSCACGNKFTVGATVPEISVDVCSNCHPYFTGQMKYIDAAGRVDAFRAKMQKATKAVSKTEKRKLKREKKQEEENLRPESLSQLRNQ